MPQFRLLITGVRITAGTLFSLFSSLILEQTDASEKSPWRHHLSRMHLTKNSAYLLTAAILCVPIIIFTSFQQCVRSTPITYDSLIQLP